MSDAAVQIDPEAAAAACGITVKDLAAFLREGADQKVLRARDLMEDEYVDNSPEGVAAILGAFDEHVAGARNLLQSALACERYLDEQEES